MCRFAFETSWRKSKPSQEVTERKIAIVAEMRDLMNIRKSGGKWTLEQKNRHIELMIENKSLNLNYIFDNRSYHRAGKEGLKDFTGKTLVPAKYKCLGCEGCYDHGHYDDNDIPIIASNEENKRALVKLDGQGTLLTPFEYDHIIVGEIKSFAILFKDQLIGLCDLDGKVIIPCELHHFYENQGGLYRVYKFNKVGFFTPRGLYIQPVYEDSETKNGFLHLLLEDKWGFVDEFGNFIADEEEERLSHAKLIEYHPTPVF